MIKLFAAIFIKVYGGCVGEEQQDGKMFEIKFITKRNQVFIARSVQLCILAKRLYLWSKRFILNRRNGKVLVLWG